MSAPCSVSVFTSTECGLSSLHPKETEYVKLYDCQKDITSYLKRLGLKCGQRCDFLADVQSEGHLISYQIGLFSLNGLMRVCPMHRDKLGVHWIPPKTCQHPEHIGKMKPFRPVTPKIAQDILCEKGYLIPVGAGVNIKNYCYSEAQSGKSYCDAKIAHMRTRMKTYVASGHDIITAEDMKTALDDGKGVVGCQVAVVAIDTSKQTITSHKMKNINSYNEIIFSDTGITVKQLYGIGAGLSFTHNKLGQFSVAQNETGCVLIKDFSQPSTRAGTIQFSQSQRTTNYEFSCTEAGCTLSFDSYKSLEDHVHLGEHQMAMETQTTFDKVRRQWGKYCNSIFVS